MEYFTHSQECVSLNQYHTDNSRTNSSHENQREDHLEIIFSKDFPECCSSKQDNIDKLSELLCDVCSKSHDNHSALKNLSVSNHISTKYLNFVLNCFVVNIKQLFLVVILIMFVSLVHPIGAKKIGSLVASEKQNRTQSSSQNANNTSQQSLTDANPNPNHSRSEATLTEVRQFAECDNQFDRDVKVSHSSIISCFF